LPDRNVEKAAGGFFNIPRIHVQIPRLALGISALAELGARGASLLEVLKNTLIGGAGPPKIQVGYRNARQPVVLRLPEVRPRTLTQFLGSRSRERAVPLIGLRQQLDILWRIGAAKPLDGALTLLEVAGWEVVRTQPLDLDSGIAADLLEKVQQEPLLGFAELVVAETKQQGLNPGIAGILPFNTEFKGSKPVEELTNMFDGLD